jgi:hypothetical protein
MGAEREGRDMSRARTTRVLVEAIAVAATMSIGVRTARACGGFFCDRPSPTGGLPIAQAAENVLFVMGNDPATGAKTVEAHVQILYTGPASSFSWIVPVTAVPTVDVGWDILFDRIEPPTRPSFQLTYQTDGKCQGAGGDGVGCSGTNAAGSGGGEQTHQPPPAVDVISQGSIGPYDYVIVKSADGATLRTWLTDNGYYVSDDAGKIVDDYVASGSSFVAVKLQAGQDTSAIRPIILRLQAAEACLPLKLTAIASTPDLRINVWVLAAGRAIPINYVEVAVNLAKIDWFNYGKNYDQLLKEAANEAMGDAFAVEYAQPSAASVAWFTLAGGDRVATLSGQPDPQSYLSALSAIGVTPTSAVIQVLRKYIPEPAALMSQGVTEAQFYTNIQYYNAYQLAPIDPVALTTELQAEIFTPMDMFRDLFQRNAYLTRLATFISPEEMTKDPLFVTNLLLSDVSPQHKAIGHVLCGDEEFNQCAAPIRVDLEDGRSVVYAGPTCGGVVDRKDIDAMPSAEAAWNRDSTTEGQLVVDNRPAIAQAIAAHNATVPTPGSGCGCSLRAQPRRLAMILFACGVVATLAMRRRRR